MRAIFVTLTLFTSCTSQEKPSLTFIDAPAIVNALAHTNLDLVVTLEAQGFDGPMRFRLDNFTSDTVVEGEIVDRTTATIDLAGCFFGAEQQGNFLWASIGEVTGRADITVACGARQ